MIKVKVEMPPETMQKVLQLQDQLNRTLALYMSTVRLTVRRVPYVLPDEHAIRQRRRRQDVRWRQIRRRKGIDW